MRDDDPGPGGSVLSDWLGLLPERQLLRASVDDLCGMMSIRGADLAACATAVIGAALGKTQAAERERCADVCDTIYAAINGAYAAKVCAAAIRGRIREHCPFPWTGDNGSVSQCKERGHCGCGA